MKRRKRQATADSRTRLARLVDRPRAVAAGNQPRRICPHRPWPKQQTFLQLDCLEAFYGGAAGGGKSEALLLCALQYVHVPGYAALILRKDTQRLKLAGGLIPRSHEWLSGSGAVWNGSERSWTFPTSGAAATLRFGYLSDAQDKYRYSSSEFQYIAFDELTEFPEDDYLFLFSRLRKTKSLAAPLRMRSASNPGGLGHAWVKQRFIAPHARVDARGVQWNGEIAYLPATIDDNPALDAERYRRSLRHLPALTRERLMSGDWSLREDGLVRADQLRYFRHSPQHGTSDLFARDGRLLATLHERDCRRFITIDPAGTSADRVRERRGRSPSWSALQVWEQSPHRGTPALLLRHAMRGRFGFDELCRRIRELFYQWHPERIWIENEKLGAAAVDVLERDLPIACIPTGGRDKVARAAWLFTRLERGEIYLPEEPLPWRIEFEAELLAWTGDPEEVADQIDAAAYAAQLAERQTGGAVTLQPMFATVRATTRGL